MFPTDYHSLSYKYPCTANFYSGVLSNLLELFLGMITPAAVARKKGLWFLSHNITSMVVPPRPKKIPEDFLKITPMPVILNLLRSHNNLILKKFLRAVNIATILKKATYTLLPLVVALRLIFVTTIVSPSSEVL